MNTPAKKGAIAVTGASRGIGAAICVELARRGFRVACLSRAGKGVEDLPVPAEAAGRMIADACDVTDDESIAHALRSAADRAGGLQGLVNNAGIHHTQNSATLPTADFEQMLRTNLIGAFVACREAYPYLVANKGGLIVNIGSYYERLGVIRSLAYTASKAAVGAMTRCLAVEWAQDDIIVLDLAPGIIRTNLNRTYLERPSFQKFAEEHIPLKRPGTVEDVAHMVGMLFAEGVRFTTGETIFMDGGQSIAH
jgi:NAD(P)-dependent dehydrogenase (short-subunit alcohol dehydrogenase family)